MKKQIGVILSLMLMVSCGKSGDSSQTTSSGDSNEPKPEDIVGKDFTGSYLFTSVECFNSKTKQLTVSAPLSNNSAVIKLNIKGNNSQLVSIGADCTSKKTGKIYFYDNLNYDMKETLVTVENNLNSCVYQVLPLTINLTPFYVNVKDYNNTKQPDLHSWYTSNKTQIGLYSVFKHLNSPDDVCFNIFDKSK